MCGHRFFHLKDDVSGLRWRITELLKSGGINISAKVEVERELERLVDVVRSELRFVDGQ